MVVKILSNEDRSDLHQEWVKRLEDWRNKIGWSQKTLPTKIDLSLSTLKTILKGEKAPSDKSLVFLLIGLYKEQKALGLSPDEILDWMALLGFTKEGVLSLLQDERPLVVEILKKVQAWLQIEEGIRPFVRPALPSAYVERKNILDQIMAGLTCLSGYRQQRHRVVLLHGVSGSGKTTLGQGVLHFEQVQAYFRSGALYLNGANGSDAISKQIDVWEKWLTDETTVGLVVLNDINDEDIVERIVCQAARQVTLLWILRDRDTAPPILSRNWDVQNALIINVSGLNEQEALALVAKMGATGKAAEADALKRVVRTITHPLPLRLLAAEAVQQGWEQVAQWVWDLKAEGAVLTAYWERFYHSSWTRLSKRERRWLLQLGDWIDRGGSFGIVFASIIWGVEQIEAQERLEALTRRGWLEEVDEREMRTPAAIAQVLGGTRYRLPQALKGFIKGQLFIEKAPMNWWRRVRIKEEMEREFSRAVKTPLRLSLVMGPILWISSSIWYGGAIYWLVRRKPKRFAAWDRSWAAGQISEKLLNLWRERGQLPSEEVWLIHEQRRTTVRTWMSWLVVFLMIFILLDYWLPPSPPIWLSLAAVVPTVILVTLYQMTVIWSLTLLRLYDYPETHEMRVGRKILKRLGWRKLWPKSEPNQHFLYHPHTLAITPADKPAP